MLGAIPNFKRAFPYTVHVGSQAKQKPLKVKGQWLYIADPFYFEEVDGVHCAQDPMCLKTGA